MNNEKSSIVLSHLYNSRKNQFATSLQSILNTVAQDKIVKQMLQDRTSGQFISRRVEEIIFKVLNDDRELYIDSLLTKIQKYETILSDEYAEVLKILGTKILSISDAQNSSSLHKSRHIHALIEELKTLQEEVVDLRKKCSDNEIVIEQYQSKKFGSIRPDTNPDSPNFMHIFVQMDLTSLDLKIKEIQTDAATVKKFVIDMRARIQQTISSMFERVQESINEFEKRKSDHSHTIKLERAKFEKVIKSYEEDVIPKMIQNHTNQMSTIESDLKQAKASSEQLNNQLFEENQKVTSLSRQQKKIIRLSEKLSKKCSQYESLNLELHDNLENTTTQLAQEQVKNQELSLRISQNEATIAEMNEIIQKNQNQIKNLNTRVLQETQRAEDSSSYLVQRVTEVEALTRKLGIANTTILTLKEESLKQSTQISNQEAKIISLETTKQENLLQLGLLSKELKESKKQSSDTITSFREECKRLQDDNHSSLQTINDLNNTLERLNQQISLMTEENSQLKKSLSDYISSKENTINDLNRNQSQLSLSLAEFKSKYESSLTQIASLQKENSILKSRLDEISEENQEKMVDVEEKRATIAKLLYEKEINKENISSLEDQINKMSLEKSNLEQEFLKLRAMNKSLTEHNLQLKNHIQNSSSDNQIIETRLQLSEKKNSELLDQLEKLKDENIEFQENITELKNINMENNSIISNMNKQLKELSKIVETDSHPNCVLSLEQWKKDHTDIQTIKSIIMMGDHDDIIQQIRELKNRSTSLLSLETSLSSKDPVLSVKQMMTERSTISSFLDIKQNEKLVEKLQSLIQAKDSLLIENRELVEYILTIFSLFSNSKQSPSKASTILAPKRRQQMINAIQSTISIAKQDREQILHIIEEAEKLGYTGSRGTEAAQYIAQHMFEQEKQLAMIQLKNELESVRLSLENEKEEHKKENDKFKKKITEQRSLIAKISEEKMQLLTEQSNQNEDLMSQIRKLQEDIRNEKTLRLEIARIGAGDVADRKLLKSKLSDTEFKFVEFIQKIMNQEKESRVIHEQMKKEREKLGDVI